MNSYIESNLKRFHITVRTEIINIPTDALIKILMNLSKVSTTTYSRTTAVMTVLDTGHTVRLMQSFLN